MEHYSIRNFFYLGNYSQCIKEAETKIKQLSDPDLIIQIKIPMWSSYICLGKYDEVINALKSASEPELQILHLHATYRKNRSSVSNIIDQIPKDLNPLARSVAATFLLDAGLKEDALKLIFADNQSLEALSLCIHIYLQHGRTDLAEKKLKMMKELDDDDTLTQLSSVWIEITHGGNKAQEASLVVQELIEKCGNETMKLANLQAACQMSCQNWQKAFDESLKEPLEKILNTEIESSHYDLNLLINSLICLQQLHAPDIAITKVVNKLKQVENNVVDSHWSNPWMVKNTECEKLFDDAVTKIQLYK